MNTDPDRIECTLQNDARLVAGAAAIVSHVAQPLNLASETQENLAGAVAEACKAVLQGSGAMVSTILLEVERQADHIEVTLDFIGECPPAALLQGALEGSARKTVGSTSNGQPPAGVDQVRFKTIRGHSRLTLIKYARPVPSNSKG